MKTSRSFLPAILFASSLAAGYTCVIAPANAAPPAAAKQAAEFFAPVPDAGAHLPADGFFPRGRKLAFMGYSGKAERDLTNGFSVAGPVYGDQTKYLEECFTRHLPVVAQVDTGVRFIVPKGQTPPPLDLPAAEAKAKEVVIKLAGHPEIIWWSIEPEELRPWVKQEMEYLARISKVIRDNDPQKRPVFLYNPNHRNAATLKAITAHVDILGKGCYTNSAGRKNDRAWVRWSVEEEIKAAKAEHEATGRIVTPIVMPELCKDPDPAEDAQIESWVRHDVYLGLCSGAKSVLLWSLYPRPDVKRTWKIWYDAYAKCGRELGNERNLGEVFLFGTPKNDLQVTPASADGGNAALNEQTQLENGTTTAEERKGDAQKAPDFTVCERAIGSKRYLFVINSRGADREFTAAGWPASAKLTDAFTGAPLAAKDAARFTLPAWGIRAIVAERN